MIRLVTIKEMESVTNNLTKQKAAGPNGIIGEFYQIFKEIMPFLCNLFQRKLKQYSLMYSVRPGLPLQNISKSNPMV